MKLEAIDWHSVPTDVPKIPEINKDYVREHATRIKPLLEQNQEVYHCKVKCDYFSESYPWVAKPTGPANLKEIARIWTLHGYGYHGFFKPSIAEVIVQIPKELLLKTDFYLVRGPDTVDDLNATSSYVFQKGVHVAQTILYQKLNGGEEVGEFFEGNNNE